MFLKINENVWLIPGIRGANAYIVTNSNGEEASAGLTLIDTGMPGNALKIIEFIQSIGLDPRNGLTIILTHPDIDHSGSVAELKEKTVKTSVAIHEADAPRLSGEKANKEVKGVVGVLFKAFSGLMRFSPVKADIILKGGEEINGLTVINTPGHTEGSISLYSQNLSAIFVGDALKTDRNGQIRPPSRAMTSDMSKALESLKTISSFDYEALLPGHGAPILKEASTKMKEFVKELD